MRSTLRGVNNSVMMGISMAAGISPGYALNKYCKCFCVEMLLLPNYSCVEMLSGCLDVEEIE